MPYVDKFDFDEGDVYEGTRVCKECGERKSMTEFHWGPNKTCRRRLCKSCQHAQQRRARSKNLDVFKMRGRQSHLRKKYGIDQADYLRMRDEQGDLCLICRDSLPEPAYVDHCHETGRVRGLLCLTCNTGIGSFKERPEVLIWAAAYLLKHKGTMSNAKV